MTFPVYGPQRNGRTSAVIAEAQRALERFAKLNPFWAKRAFVRVEYRGSRYLARAAYTATCGGSVTVSVAFEQPQGN